MALGLSVATDIASAALSFYVRGKAFKQTIQDKPLLKVLDGAKKTFPGGKDNVSYPVQGVFMNAQAGFFAGYSEDDALAFKQASNLLRAEFPWKEAHAGLMITWTELKKDGITVTDSQKTSDHSQVELTRLTGILENRLDDYGESWSRSMNDMLWRDGTQDTKVTPGVKALLTEDPTTGTTGGLDRATYTWWRHRFLSNIPASEENQTLSKTLRREVRQLRRFGGRPSVLLCGSLFLEALEIEVQAKGQYTVEGFLNAGKNDVGMADISMRGVGTFQYDPTLDDLGEARRCYVIDTKHLTLHPMEGEENKMLNPERPYNYLVFIRSMTWTGALGANQLNCHGIYDVAAP
jgi:hypothetical protein